MYPVIEYFFLPFHLKTKLVLKKVTVSFISTPNLDNRRGYKEH